MGPLLELDANYRYNRRLYQEELFENENAATGNARLIFNAIPGRLQVMATNTRTETAIRSIVPNNPDNRQITGNTQAGPTLRFQVRGKDEIQLQYLYGQRSSDRTNSDGTSHSGVLRYLLESSASSSFSIEAIWQQVQFENRMSADLKSKTGQIVWEKQARTLSFESTFGYKRVERNLGRDDVNDAIGELEAVWQFGPFGRLSLSASRDLRDQSRVLGFGSEEFGRRLVSDSDLNELFVNDEISISGQQRVRATNISISLFKNRQDYEDILRDSEYSGIRLTANRRLNRRMTVDASIQLLNQEFNDQDIEFEQLISSLQFSWRVNRAVTFSASAFYDDREPENNLFAQLGYEELGLSLRLDYKILQ